jgi:hypothetical protein
MTNHALRRVSKAGAVSTLAGGGGKGFADGQGAVARFNEPASVMVTANGDYVMTNCCNHAVRVVTPGGAVRTLAGNGEPGFVDGQGAAARFNHPSGLALDVDGSILVVDFGNHAVRRVTMAGTVSTVAGNGQQGYADGEGAAAHFNRPSAVVVDKEGTIVVADTFNDRLRRMTGRHVTTLAGGSEASTSDGAGAGARFKSPLRLALDERGCLLVSELRRVNTLRVVEASLAPPPWMGPVAAAAVAPHDEAKAAALATLEDYGRLVEDGDLSDVVFVVDVERLPAHRVMLAARSKYFAGLFKSGMPEGSKKGGSVDEDVSAFAFRVLLRFLYTGELPVWEGRARGAGGGGAGGSGGVRRAVGGRRSAGCESGKEGAGGNNGGKGGKGKEKDKEEKEAASAVQELLWVADRFQAEVLYEHCLSQFWRALTVETAVQHLVWAHRRGHVGARELALKFMTANCQAIQVALSYLACSACG